MHRYVDRMNVMKHFDNLLSSKVRALPAHNNVL